MKSYITLLFIIFYSSSIFATAPSIDSLKKSLPSEDFKKYLLDYTKNTTIEDTNQYCLALFHLGNILLDTDKNPQEAKAYFEKGLNLATEFNPKDHLIRFKQGMGFCYRFTGKLEQSIKVFQEAINIAEAHQISHLLPTIYSEKARVYYMLKDYESAIQYLNQGKEIAKKNNKKDVVSSILNNIGVIYKNQKKWKEAIEVLNESLDLAKEGKDTTGTALTLNNIGNIFYNLNQLDSAYFYYKAALNTKPINPSTSLLGNLTKVILQEKGDPIPYLDVLNRAYLDNLRSENLQGQLDISKALYDYYEKAGNYKSAFKHLNDYQYTYNRILYKTRIEQTAKLKEEFETEIKQKEIENLTQKTAYQSITNKQNRALIFILLILLATLIALGILFFKNSAIKQESQKLILEQQLLRSQMNPHFIFNSISNIQSFILNEEDDLAIEYLGKFSRLTRQTLENSGEKSVALNKEIDALKNYLDLQSIRFDGKLNYTINTADVDEIDLLDIPPMLIQPFVENAVEHGLKPLKSNGQLSIVLTQKEEFIHCIITDNGVGRPTTPKTQSHKKSMSTNITEKRLAILSRDTKQKPQFEIIDLKDEQQKPSGTKVILDIPII